MTARKKPAPKAKTPEPVVVSTVCSLCGENWHAHRADANGEVTTLECIRLLKAARFAWPTTQTIYVQQHYVNPQPFRWYTSSTTGNITGSYGINSTTAPKVLEASAA